MQLDEQKRTSTPAGPRLTKLEKMKRIPTERKKVMNRTDASAKSLKETEHANHQRFVASLSSAIGIKFDDDDYDDVDDPFPTLASSLGLIALPHHRNRAIHLAASPFSMGVVSTLLLQTTILCTPHT